MKIYLATYSDFFHTTCVSMVAASGGQAGHTYTTYTHDMYCPVVKVIN